ncbi:ankyrin repeat domain-containing protein 26-like [Castor canadensis]|uniref:Ankyrin repeat domain-containing protein 26-like n=1 Tax=Castor canadensis TaxID=51338 RepID=A0AC58KZR6_CASCN
MESILKNIESEAAKLQIQLELNEIELEKYNKEYLEELSQLNALQHEPIIIRRTKECLEEAKKLLLRTEHNRPILDTMRTRPVTGCLSDETMHCNLGLNRSCNPRGSLFAPSSTESLDHYLSGHFRTTAHRPCLYCRCNESFPPNNLNTFTCWLGWNSPSSYLSIPNAGIKDTSKSSRNL